MRVIVMIVTALLLIAGPASAATPVSPTSGSVFTTGDKEKFVAESQPGEPDYLFLFSKGAALNKTEWFALGGQDDGDGLGNDLRLDLGWLALKFNHIGAYSWALCPVSGPDLTPAIDQCSASSSFSVRFRLSTLTRKAARADALTVMNQRFRDYWRGGYHQRISCRRVTRTRQSCNVSVSVGDSVLWGRVTIYNRRTHAWDEPYFRARIHTLDEYCYQVDKRPLKECQTTRRRSGSVYG